MLKQLLAALTLLTVLSPASATLTFTLTQEGPDVIGRVNGSVNTAAIPPVGGSTTCNGPTGVGAFLPSTATVCVAGSNLIGHPGLVGPTSFGAGGAVLATSGAGDAAFIQGSTGTVYLPPGYVSGSVLSGSSVFPGTTLAAMGAPIGTYTYTFGAGPTADTAVVIIGGEARHVAVPALNEYGMLALVALLMLSAALSPRKSRSGRP